MKKLHKLFPPHLSQLVFMDKKGENLIKINSIDYDLFIWLIYNVHKKYDKNKSLSYDFEYTDIKKTFKKTMNTKVIRESLKRIGKLLIISNYLQSYGDKEIIVTKPFEIEIITADNGISYGFNVKTTNEFMNWFNNPTPKVDVNYDIIYNLKPTMSKLLYLFLRDAYGGYENCERYRNVAIDKLRHMMNVSNPNTTNSNFITQLKKSIKSINKNSDLTVKANVKKKKNLRTGLSEIIEVKFTMKWDKNKEFELRLKEKKAKKTPESIDSNISDTETDDIEVECTFEDYLSEKVEDEYEFSISNGTLVKNEKSYKHGIRKKLLEDGIESEYEFLIVIENEKSLLRESVIDKNQPYMLIYKDGENPYNSCYINNECQFITMSNKKKMTNTISESLEFIEENRMKLHFDILKCDYSDKYQIGRL